MLSVRTVRAVALAVCVAGIAGMIVTSILGHNGAAVTFGLITAVAVVCSMVAKAVAAPLGVPPDDPRADAMAALVEEKVQSLVAAGAPEDEVRRLVGEAVRYGRSLGPGSFPSGAGRERRRSGHAGNV